MRFLSFSILSIFLVLTPFNSKALATTSEGPAKSVQEQEEVQIEYRDHTYRDNIKTVQLYRKDDQLSFPLLYLGSTDQLELHFDDLNTDYETYNYSIVHCNSNWEPSDLMETEYLSDFFDGFIEDYQYSINTLFPYIHYKVAFPNDQVKFKLSGNYLLKVYANNNEEELLLTKRFYVVEKRVTIESDIRMATLARHRDYKQEVDFTINHTNYPIQDVYADLKVIIMQNRRWDNAITDLKPLFIRSPELVYNYEDKNLFDGDNEYRFFETRNLRYQSLNIDGIQIMGGKTHVYLLPEEPRSFKRYLFGPDINGKRQINRENSPLSNREADYMLTHFNLKKEQPVPGGDIYVFGELSDWEYKPEFKMKYVEVNGAYELTTQIKQGYYNYSYAYLPNGETKGDLSTIEGTHSETNNDYYIFVYHRENGTIYDKLVGFEFKTVFAR